MNHLFLRLYLLVAITIVGLGWSIDRIYDQHLQQADALTDSDVHKGTLFLLNRELLRYPQSQRKDYLSAAAASFGYPLALLTMQQVDTRFSAPPLSLTAQQRTYLERGGLLALYDDDAGSSWFLQRMSEGNEVMVLGPIDSGVSTSSDALFSSLFLAGLALAVFIWAWPLSRGLVSLTRSTEAFGKGDFQARASLGVPAPLQPLAQRFNAMARRIQRLIKSHKELSHAVSHELRTPVARIRFALEMARDADDPKQHQHYLDTMDSNIEELDDLIDELLAYARFDREEPQLTIQPLELAPLLAATLDNFRMTHGHLTLTLDVRNTNLRVNADRDALTRVIDNLLRNAVRYARQHICVSASLQSDKVEIRIDDDGPGVPEADRQQLFDPFVRLDTSRDRTSGGIGLGLAIVQRFVELHHGSVEIESAELGGASFVIHLPQLHHLG
ncbi:hypothetical protein LJ739_01825 [Aestuariibacter halophilus]|uniref:histidine kinase n=1 Tax=Fluctibacter halophilus TaxID=226011 RepID=A0ABS8G3C0_9ALTE|nr:ATP-binding protein [Aestuariibacter halophilus]MCC2614978.1 hypothetical protein [Aestuariibacter halophilus]